MSRRSEQDSEDDERTLPRGGWPIDPRRVLRVAWGQRKTIAAAVAAGLVVGVLVAKFAISHTYLANAVVRYDGLPGQSIVEAQQDVPSLASVAMSDRYVAAMRARAGLSQVSLDAMRILLQVGVDAGTRQVTFSGHGKSPDAAAALANRAATLFLEHQAELRETALRAEKASLTERILAASTELHQARAAYDAFRRENGLGEASLEQAQITAQAAELRTQAIMAAAEVEAARARLRQMRESQGEGTRTRVVPTNGASRRLEDARVTELSQRLREARGQGLGDSHPQVQSLQRQVAALERTQQEAAASPTEGVRVTGGAPRSSSMQALEAEVESLESRRAALEQLAAAADARGSRAGDMESQAASRLAQVEVKGAQVESLTQRAAAIDDQLHDVPTGFRLVSEAIPPEDAIPSKKKKIVALAIPLLVGIVTLVYVVLRDFRRLRLISPPEIAWWGAGPVVATSTWPRDSLAFDELLADLEELLREKRGELLVVGATEVERRLADELVAAIQTNWRGVLVDDLQDAATFARAAGVTGAGEGAGGHSNVLPLGRRGRLQSVPGGAVPSNDETGAIRVRHALRVTSFVPDGPHSHSTLRRAARRADGVLVLVGAGVEAPVLRKLRENLARDSGVAYALLAVSQVVSRQDDRSGEPDSFLDGFVGGA